MGNILQSKRRDNEWISCHIDDCSFEACIDYLTGMSCRVFMNRRTEQEKSRKQLGEVFLTELKTKVRSRSSKISGDFKSLRSVKIGRAEGIRV